MKLWADEESRKILSKLEICMAERVVESQQTHFESSKARTNHYTSGCYSPLNDLKREPASAVSE